MKTARIVALLLAAVTCSFAAQKAEPGTKARAEQATPVAAVDDATITAGVKEKLSNVPSLKDTPIEVQTKDGVVTLKGTVKAPGLKGVATDIAKSVTGVKKVDNQIAVEKGAAIPKGKGKAATTKKS